MVRSAKNWSWTLNNYDESDIRRLEELGSRDEVRYLCYGREVGGASGTPHLQGFVSFRSRRTLGTVRELLSPRIHAEISRGSPQSNRDYCKKDGNFAEFGELPAPRGCRSDISAVVTAIKNGTDRGTLLSEYSGLYARAYRTINDAYLLYARSRDWMPVTRVYWGATGTGKTRKAYEEAQKGGTIPYFHPGGSWFDGYFQGDCVIFDDFGGSEFKITYLLKLLDRYPMRVPVKGGFTQWVPKQIWITSNYHPNDWFPNAKDEHKRALIRRFDEIVHFRSLAPFDE